MNPLERPRKQLPEEPVTLSKIDEMINSRINSIEGEFRKGFEFIKHLPKTVTFFGSARTMEDEEDYKKTSNLASRISKELGYAVFSGGGPGIMEAANRGAFEVNGQSVGMTIKLPPTAESPEGQITNKYLTDHVNFDFFFSRKVCMSFSAEAYIFLPGGFGTFDELFEILTLIQTKKILAVPIILYGEKFWKNFDAFVKDNLLAEEKIDEEDTNLYTITDDDNEIIDIIKNAPVRTILEN